MSQRADIHKAGAVIVQNRKLLVERSFGKTVFQTPGGKLNTGETSVQALVRELSEELGIIVAEQDLEPFGSFEAPAVGQEHNILHMDVYLVTSWQGTIHPESEVEALSWVNSKNADEFHIASIFKYKIIPQAKAQNLID